MFTGIIEETGKVLTVTNQSITVQSESVIDGTKNGDSISVNGVCLTVVELGRESFTADISPETRRVTALNNLRAGDFVNLERAVQPTGRLGGHIVTGHVDGTGKILSLNKNGDFYDLTIELNNSEAKYIVKKGSVAVNGISLTVADIKDNILKIAVIPHTYDNTNLKKLKSGDYVNIETDILSKYVEKFLSTSDNRAGISMEFLRENGF